MSATDVPILLEARGLTKSYGQVAVLKGLNLSIAEGEVVAITGPSGAGKTTLLQLLGTLETPDSGTIHVRNQEVTALTGSALALFRNQQMGYVFQFHNLLPEFTALENVLIPGLIAGRPQKEIKAHAQQLLERLGLGHRLDHKPAALSGGEQQRVAVARALMNQPAIVFADEPSGNLDSANAEALHQLFFTLRDQLGHSFVIVTHNETLAAMADRQVKLRDGIVEELIVR